MALSPKIQAIVNEIEETCLAARDQITELETEVKCLRGENARLHKLLSKPANEKGPD